MPGVVCERLEILHDGREVELVARAGEPSLGFDGDGRPTYPGCLLSISDTGAIAAAVCLWLGGLTWPAGAPASGAEAARPQMRTFPVKTRILAFLVLLSLLLLFALGLWKILELWLH
jgi:hypothetical protein